MYIVLVQPQSCEYQSGQADGLATVRDRTASEVRSLAGSRRPATVIDRTASEQRFFLPVVARPPRKNVRGLVRGRV